MVCNSITIESTHYKAIFTFVLEQEYGSNIVFLNQVESLKC